MVLLFIVGSLTGLIYTQDYAVGTAYIDPVETFEIEAKLSHDLYESSVADFILFPSSDWLILPQKWDHIYPE